ncbi:LPP20 family lipoprotein [Cryomorphaceae bacterium]|nr:LPP20 family lipoprotein [Cryomorphaceae bacterium]
MSAWRYILIMAVLATSLGACSSAQKTVQTPKEKAPTWIGQRPSNPDYYIGLGRSSKSLNPLDYNAVAKQNALEDLAGEISVNVNANSVLSQTEDPSGYAESYRSQIRTRTDIELEGFEVYDTWEDNERYYVLYRLSKRDWAAAQEAKKRKAVAQSKDWYGKALRADEEHRAVEALTYYVKALESIEAYLGEPLEEFDDQGQKHFYGNEVYFRLAETLQGLNVASEVSKRTMKQGTLQENESLDFILVNESDIPQSGLPVLIKYSEQLSRGTVFTSGESGQVTYPVPVIRTNERTQYIRARFDSERWQQQVTDNRLVRDVLEGLVKKVKETVVELEVLAPTFRVASLESNLGTPLSTPMLASAVRSVLLENGFASDTTNPDYSIHIESDTDSSGVSRNMATCYLRGQMIIKRGVEEIYRTSFHEIKGVQLNYQNAGMAAYREGVDWLTYEVLPLWVDRVRPTR